MFIAVVRLVAVFKRTMQAYWNWLSVADIFLRLARHCSAQNRKKKLTEKTPSKKENNKLRKFKVLRHGNTGDKLASQKPAKTVSDTRVFIRLY